MSWKKLYIDQINLSGIHKDLLDKQGNGLSRVIGEMFPDLSDKSAWLGGNGEAWERGPYYIDGLIPLAYLLNDDELINLANKWVEAILSSQKDSGFFGPKKNNDWWPRAVVLKALVSAYPATRDEKIIDFSEKYLSYFLKHVSEMPFDFWAYARGMEGFEMITFLKERIGDVTEEELKRILKENTIDWQSFFTDFPYVENTDKYMPKHLFHLVKYFTNIIASLKKSRKNPPKVKKYKILKNRDKKNNLIFLKTHGVNIAMALKYLLYWGKSQEVMFQGLDNVLKYHGNATGIFSSDEHLNGTSPNSGIELCTVVEMMYSMEEAIRITGSMEASDRLEKYAYNALLSTIRPDFSSHQYVQQINQLDCEVKPHPFYDSNRYANTFGIEPNYGCCAANMHQGWPKMMLSAVMSSKSSLGIFLYISGTYKVEFPDGHVLLEIKTAYPFSDNVIIKCLESKVLNIDWLFRIPYKANTLIKINDEVINIENKDSFTFKDIKTNDLISLTFNFDIITLNNPDNSISVQRGPLIYSEYIDYEEFYIKGNKPFHDRGFKPKEIRDIKLFTKAEEVIVKDIKKHNNDNDFFDNHINLIVEAYDQSLDKTIDLNLKPYGLSTLRRTHFDKISIKKSIH